MSRTSVLGPVPLRAAAAEELGLSGEDFYSILGLHPAADLKSIKSAYYSMMRLYHPDQHGTSSGSSTDGDATDSIDTNEFCALLNEIYTTLSNPEAREMYDAIAGFSANALNPFMDTSYPADQVFVDEVSCIGCGKCVRSCPSAFLVEESKYGRARVIPGADVLALEEDVQVAIETCPVDCIHWVSSPQLSLLEATLASMTRVDAFIMMRQQRSPGNVFEEANRAWQKRQSRMAALREQREYAVSGASSNGSSSSGGGWSSFFSRHVDFKGASSSSSSSSGGFAGAGVGGDGDDGSSKDPARRKVAALAAAASRAMRRWQLYHEVNKKTAVKALAEVE
uniref:J domain-containing protein n=1 Tax=Tetradesmus obliquus TaxID=3088 RepID=A0A383W798_TETOB|eukprot:jgi/Sobl393_1/12112/SZX72864.1